MGVRPNRLEFDPERKKKEISRGVMPSPTYPTAMHVFLSVPFLPVERGRKRSVPLGVNQAVDSPIRAFVQTPVRQACDTAPQTAFAHRPLKTLLTSWP